MHDSAIIYVADAATHNLLLLSAPGTVVALRSFGEELSTLRHQVSQFKSIQKRLSSSADLTELSDQHIFANSQSIKRQIPPASASASTSGSSSDGFGALGNFGAAAGHVSEKLRAAEDWAAQKLMQPLTCNRDDATSAAAAHFTTHTGGRSSTKITVPRLPHAAKVFRIRAPKFPLLDRRLGSQGNSGSSDVSVGA